MTPNLANLLLMLVVLIYSDFLQIGGSKLSLSIDVLSKLVDKCNSIIVIGSMVYTFFNSLGYYCPSSFVESNLVSDALKFLSMAAEKGVDVMLPVDFLCCNKDHAQRIFAADDISEGDLSRYSL